MIGKTGLLSDAATPGYSSKHHSREILKMIGKLTSYIPFKKTETAEETPPPKNPPPLRETQENQLKNLRVKPGSFAPRKTVGLLAGAMGVALQEVGGTALAAGAVSLVVSKFTGDGTAMSQNGIAQAAVTALTVATTGLVKKAATIVVSESQLDEIGASMATLEAIKRVTTDEFLSQFPEGTVSDVKLLDEDVQIRKRDNSAAAPFYERNINHRQLVLLSTPLHAKNVMDLKPEMKVKLDKLISDYPERNRSVVETLFHKIRANSVSKNPSRVQAYLFGPAGTGKTRFAHEMADILGVPLITIKCPAKGMSKLLGSTYHVRQYTTAPPDEELIGELPLRLIESGYTNPIVLIDEMEVTADNINELKLLLDPSKKTLKVGGYRDAHLDWSRATILIGSNYALTDKALLTRVPQIVFDKVDDSVKKKVASKAIEEHAELYLSQGMNTADSKRLLSTCQSSLNYLIEVDSKDFEGVRFLQNSVENLVHFIAGGICAGAPKSMDDIKSYIDTQYAQAKGKIDKDSDVVESADPSNLRTVN
jgi:hypothetical protein